MPELLTRLPGRSSRARKPAFGLRTIDKEFLKEF